MKSNGDIIEFIKKKDYIMANDNLGRGSFAQTVVLKDPYIDELIVAKKYIPDNAQIKEKFFKNFKDEIKILYKLNHKNVVRVFNYYIYEEISTGYILMEYVDGIEIDEYLEINPFDSDGYRWVSIDEIFIQLVEGFQHIEQCGIMHRDIREKNIMIDKTGSVKIIDFGIGKVYNKAVEILNDSLGEAINRQNSDTLPDEFYQGEYNSRTDMFYLAELLNRLIQKYERFFSYQTILDKMMNKSPNDRFESFDQIKIAIDKKDFLNLEISEEDRKIYQAFSNSIFHALVNFKRGDFDDNEIQFNRDISIFKNRIEKVLENNMFEENIQNNEGIISSIVNGIYTYNKKCKIKYEDVKRFLKWFESSTAKSQELILSNIITKLSVIPIEVDEIELPF